MPVSSHFCLRFPPSAQVPALPAHKLTRNLMSRKQKGATRIYGGAICGKSVRERERREMVGKGEKGGRGGKGRGRREMKGEGRREGGEVEGRGGEGGKGREGEGKEGKGRTG
ncbi:unnamed protein product [Closterium sp. NIES-64]|nr:unnamed protein product [Closterium sp. NIES-64]